MFFIGVAIKIAVLMSWRTTPVYLCKSNDLQLEIQKRYACYLTFIMDKTHHGPVIALSSEQLQQLF